MRRGTAAVFIRRPTHSDDDALRKYAARQSASRRAHRAGNQNNYMRETAGFVIIIQPRLDPPRTVVGRPATDTFVYTVV